MSELVAIVGLAVGLATLISIAVRVGKSAGRIEHAQERLEKRLDALDHIPTVLVRLGTLETVVTKHTSDIRDLLQKFAYARGREDSRHDTEE